MDRGVEQRGGVLSSPEVAAVGSSVTSAALATGEGAFNEGVNR